MTGNHEKVSVETTINKLWESPALIPVLLMLVKEHLARIESQELSSKKDPLQGFGCQKSTQQIQRYQALCQHWKQIALNHRQQQWLQEIEGCLQVSTNFGSRC